MKKKHDGFNIHLKIREITGNRVKDKLTNWWTREEQITVNTTEIKSLYIRFSKDNWPTTLQINSETGQVIVVEEVEIAIRKVKEGKAVRLDNTKSRISEVIW